MNPQRIPRKRTKGWRKPEHTINVCRPSKWGNPVKIGQTIIDGILVKTAEEAVQAFEDIIYNDIQMIENCKRELKGKNLMCFCSLNSPCHADVLLKIANAN